MLGLPYELIALVAIAAIGLLVYFGRKLSFPSGESLPTGIPWKWLLLGGAAIAVVFFAETIFGFDWTTLSIGRFVESFFGSGTAVFLWVVIIALGALILRKNSNSKPKVNAFVSGGIGGFLETTVFVVLAILVVSVASLLALGVSDALTGGKVQQKIDTAVATVRGEPLPKRAYAGAECDLEEKLNARNNRIPTEWITFTLCKDDGQFLFFVPKGTVPEIDYRDRSDRVLDSRPIADFVRIDATYGQPGGMPDLYRMFIPQGQGGSVNGFQSAVIDSVTFDIRARRK